MFKPPPGMSLREFFEKINQGVIPNNLIVAGESGFGDGTVNGYIYR